MIPITMAIRMVAAGGSLSFISPPFTPRRATAVQPPSPRGQLRLSAISVTGESRRRTRRLLRVLHLGKGLAGDAEAVDAGRHPGVARDLQQDLLDLFLRHAVVERRFDVQLELVRAVQCRDHRDVYDAPEFPWQPGPRPDEAPARLGGVLLHGHGEF